MNESSCICCQHCLAVCPQAAVSIFGLDAQKATPLKGMLLEYDNLENLLKGRRSVRRYSKEPISREVIDRLLNAAAYAPAGVNKRSVLFTHRSLREGVNSLFPSR